MADTVYVDYIASALMHDPVTMYVWQAAQTSDISSRALSFQLVREGQTLMRASMTFRERTLRFSFFFSISERLG